MRYESGLTWTTLNYDKWLYIGTGTQGNDCIPEYGRPPDSTGASVVMYGQGGDGYANRV